MTRTLYIAGAGAELEICEHWRDRIRAETTWDITYDWMSTVRGAREVGQRECDLSVADRRTIARLCDEGARAEIFWLVIPGRTSIGCWVEYGLACARSRGHEVGREVIVSGNSNRSLFASLATRAFASHEDAFAWLIEACPRTAP
ncbi:MAG: hypothetical protein ACRD2H_05105 [Terriglobales bacterium]